MISVFDLFKVGIGPSSSHTMGPMRAARRFVEHLEAASVLESVARIRVNLYGSLALTGRGHGTDRAILLGLEGESPERVDIDSIDARLATIRQQHEIRMLGRHTIPFTEDSDLRFLMAETLPRHTNGMRFTALARDESVLLAEDYYSIGGGFIVGPGDASSAGAASGTSTVPYAFASAAELLALADEHHLSIADLVTANERTWRSDEAITSGLLGIWSAMRACMDRGLRIEGILPGGLNVRRRAPRLAHKLTERGTGDPLAVMDWVNVYAMAVNEENAAGGRVVTAPTNGAAGLVPAVLAYYTRHVPDASDAGVCRFLLTAGAIGILYKENASISGAEVGCQGEVGVACSMAAGGLVAALGGTNTEVEHAAEVGMEHHLGMTCDPVGGLVQIPCIERNALGAVKAINAARLSLSEDGGHRVSLDQVIETMRQTGLDMQARYKETSLAGLALNVVEC